MAILEVQHIQKSFGSTDVLKDISFSLEKGQVLSIIGSSGSGKTTLLRCLNFLETPDKGVISVRGETLFDAEDTRRPSEAEIRAALSREGAEIRAAIPPRSYPVALCVEGERLSSPALTARLQDACRSAGSLCFIIGSSFGLDPSVKSAARLRLSVSDLTFPHQLMRVILYEAVYRCFQIDLGTRYHK